MMLDYKPTKIQAITPNNLQTTKNPQKRSYINNIQWKMNETEEDETACNEIVLLQLNLNLEENN